jgi:cbb3-type cytochrome oxidase subunit 1
VHVNLCKFCRASKGKADQPLVWIDLEMTGLDLEKDVILQIAVIITDGNLQNVIEGPELVIHHSDEVLSNMNDWCIDHHGSSGTCVFCVRSCMHHLLPTQNGLQSSRTRHLRSRKFLYHTGGRSIYASSVPTRQPRKLLAHSKEEYSLEEGSG